MEITRTAIATAVAGLGTLDDVLKIEVYGLGGRKAAALVTLRTSTGLRVAAEVHFRADRKGKVTSRIAQAQAF